MKTASGKPFNSCVSDAPSDINGITRLTYEKKIIIALWLITYRIKKINERINR